MPDANGELTTADRELTRAWFAKNWKGTIACPICQSTKWSMANHIVQAPRWALNSQLFSTYPYLPVSCDVCSNTLLFGAVKMGLVPAAVGQPPQINALATNHFSPPKVGD